MAKRFVFIIFIIFLGAFLSGYHIGIISGALFFLTKQFSLSPIQEGLAVSIILIGALIGGLTGVFADRYGRRPLLLSLAFLFILGPLITYFSPSFYCVLVGRAVTGLALGISCLITPLYLGEISPPKKRGTFVSLNQLGITLGILAAYLVNYLFVKGERWQPMIGVSVFPALFQFIALFFLPETPSWLLAHRKEAEARSVFKMIRKDENFESEYTQKNPLLNAQLTKKKKGSLLFLVKYGAYPLMLGVFLSAFQQITGINTITYYAPKILQIAGYTSLSNAILASVGIGVVNVLLTLFSLWFCDSFGRRRLLLIGTFGMALTLSVIAFSFWKHVEMLDFMILICLMGYVGFFAIGLGPVTWVVLSEIYPLAYRGSALSIANTTNWLCNYLVSLTFLNLVFYLGAEGAFILYAAMSLLASLLVFWFLPETKGKTLEEIEHSLYDLKK